MGHVFWGESCLQWCIVSPTIAPPNTDNVRLCSEHFTEECFIVDNASCYGVQEDKNNITKIKLCSRLQTANAMDCYIVIKAAWHINN